MNSEGAVPDFSVPNPARMYDYFLGGERQFPPDREAANRVIAAYPEAPRPHWQFTNQADGVWRR
jgi:hypothetical protein